MTKVKTKAALSALAVKFRYDLDVEPAPLPVGPRGDKGQFSLPSNAQLVAFFGVPEGWAASHGTSQHQLLSELSVQWEAHRAAWRPPAAQGPRATPSDVFDYWSSLKEGSLPLSQLAVHNWSSPVSNAAAERVFRILTHMDDPTRHLMEHLSVENQLFLRVNCVIVLQLAEELVADLLERQSSVTARAAEAASIGKHRRQINAAAASEAAMSNLRNGATNSRPRRAWRLMEPMSDGEDDVEAAMQVLNREALAGLDFSASAAGAAVAAPTTLMHSHALPVAVGETHLS